MRPRKKINQKDIADALGVSNVTVSNALAGRKGVGGELLVKIRKMAARMGYGVEEEHAGRTAETVLIVTPAGLTADKTGWLEQTVREQGMRARFRTIQEVLNEQEAGEPESLSRPDGAEFSGCLGVLAAGQLSLEELSALGRISEKNGGKPVVGVGFFDNRVPIDYVIDDGFHTMQAAVFRLSERGYENILYVKPDESGLVSDILRRMRTDRLLGYRSGIYLRALRSGQDIEQAEAFELGDEGLIPDWQHFCASRSTVTFTTCGVNSNDYFQRWNQTGEHQKSAEKCQKDGRTAFLCEDADTACRLTAFLIDRGIKVPENTAVIGYCAQEELWKNLFEKGCEIIYDRTRTGKTAEGIHLVSGSWIEVEE